MSSPKLFHTDPFQSEIVEYLRNTLQDEKHLEKLLTTLTLPPLFTTIRIPWDEQMNEVAKMQFSQNLSEQCESMGCPSFQHFIHPALKDCVIVENQGPNVLEKHAKEIVVDLYCGMAVLRGAHVFKQGILAAPHGLKTGDNVSVYADLDGKCLKGTASSYSGDKIHVGNGITQVTRSDLFKSDVIQSGIGIMMTDPLYRAPSLADLQPALFFPQNLPSIVCAHALDPKPGEIILDLCAAPGGKTTHIAALMGSKGRVVALEKSAERVSRMKEMLQKIHSSIIETYAFDSTKALDPDSDPDGGPPYPPATFDCVLVDAPCSALGQRPCLVNRMSLNQLKSFPVVQHKLLQVAVQLLKPGGVLVYSTCTLPIEENEDQVHRMMKKFPCMSLVTMPFKMGTKGLTNSQLSDYDRSLVTRFDPSIPRDDNGGGTLPCDKDTIGFFIAKFQKAQSNDDKD